MTDLQRRIFLRRSTMLVASGALTACGGGGGGGNGAAAAPTSTAASGVQTPSSGPFDPGTPATPEPGAPIPNARFSVISTTGQTSVPFCLGFAFRRGDLPASRSIGSDKGALQINVKNLWPDGSVKFALLSGQASLPTAAGTTINLGVVTSSAGDAAIDTARLRNSGAVAEVGCGAFGTASWQGADWDSPFKVWVSGPLMSSWIYRKPVGSDPHLVAWLEVRMWASGALEVLPWIENGYLRVAAPSNKAATYTFSLNGSARMSAAIDLKHHQRTPLISGSALSYWGGADPGVVPRQDAAYLQASELVPSYQARLTAESTAVKALVSSYTPLQAGNFIYDGDSMASSGYQDPIGLLPQHDVLFLVADVPATYAAVVRNGFSAGRYGLHYRDESTNRPLRFSSYPTLNIRSGHGFKDTGGSTNAQYTPVATGGNPPTWDVAHSPSVGFAAYLVTGRFYFMEQVQFAATANYLGNGDNAALRTGSKGLVQTAVAAWQTRSCAWDWRARVQALCVTPDDDSALRAEFIASVEANIEHFHGRYVAQPNNPFGWIKPGEGYDGTIRVASPWQQDFVTAAFGYSVSLGLPISAAASTKLGAFFAWKARSAVGRLGTKDGFWYVNAVPYTMVISPVAKPDYDTGAGPWYSSEAEVYSATYAKPPVWLGKVEGTLAGEYMPGERALWGNLVPAIAYAVRHGVPGAREAYERMTRATNWGTLRAAFDTKPVWGVKPAHYTPVQPLPVPSTPQAGDPIWFSGKGLGEWIEIAGTAGAGGAAAHAYSGIAFNERTNEILIAGAGGHLDSADNRVVSLRLTDNAPVWQLRHGQSSATAIDVAYYADGKPTSRHLYSTVHFVPQLNRLMMFGVRGAYGNAHFFNKVDGFDLETNSWDPAGTWADAPPGHLGAVSIRATGDTWSTGLARFSAATRTWSQPITQRTNDTIRWPIAHDSLRNQLFSLNWADGMGYGALGVFASRVPVDGSVQISVTFNPSAALDSFKADKPTYAGMDYDPANDRFLFYCGQGAGAGRIYVIKPNGGNTWDMSMFELASPAMPPATTGAGVHNRFRYVPALRGFMLMPNGKTHNIFFIRTSA
ncbi:hypothetical protein [Massilia scottii]|uniref:hypothetical protein n=1 Tax=Massilia scottii TaxID=3057166 RepID=UPI002796676B|nr:hypothetical protein [Massilia sp. CCM 9029]MDQ1830152.1 hypothetical protein [Massilia sp. CCM 9029]